MNLPSDLTKFSYKGTRLIVGLIIMMFTSNVSFAQSQNLLELEQAAKHYLSTHYQSVENEKLEIKMGHWDRRLSLAKCQQDIAFSLQDSAAPGGNVTLSCKCKDQSGWMVHLPASVSIYQKIPVATSTINRGKTISLDDIRMELRNINETSDELISLQNNIIGKAAKRTINSGDTFRNSMLEQPKTVNRGETVTITATASGIQVVMQGTAITDGKLGQRIRVRNNQSERIISAKVVGIAAVEIL